jgi:Leucine-rich repeat (LRR) protein
MRSSVVTARWRIAPRLCGVYGMEHLVSIKLWKLFPGRMLCGRRVAVLCPPPPSLTRLCFAQADEYTAAAARAVAEDNARAAPVLISGARGSRAQDINGFFVPTQEKGLDGRVMYAKCGDPGRCIEHGAGVWQVKRTSDKGTDKCVAYVAGGRGLEACSSHTWRVLNYRIMEDQRDVKVATAADGVRSTSLSLAGCIQNPGGSEPVAEFLREMTAVTELHVSGNNLSLGEAASISNALTHLTTLGTLNARGSKLGSAGLRTLMGGVTRLTGLTSLDISWNDALCDGVDAFALTMSMLESLKGLYVAGNKLGSAGLRTLMGGVTRLTGLTSLNLGHNELSADDGARVCGAAAAAGMTLLAALELEGNGFTAACVVGCEGWREAGLSCSWDHVFFPQSFDMLIRYAVSSDRAAVAEANRHPLLPAALLRRIESSDPSLTSVDIAGSAGFGDASKYMGSSRVVACLAEALCLNTCITSLNVAGNKLGSAGLRTLMGGVTRLTGLTSLDISSNDALCDGADAFALTISQLESLKGLNVAGNRLGSAGLRTLMGGVTRLTGLTSLNLGQNELSADDGARVCGAAAAAGMSALARLDFFGNGFIASSVVDCDEWRKLALPQPPDEIVRQGFDSLIQYLLSENRVATNAIRIFVVGESTVRCFTACGCCARSFERCFVFE